MDDTTKDRIQDFEKRNLEITVNNWKQALVPEGCIVLDNENGTAPGIICDEGEKKTVVLLPGPPNELIPMFEEQVIPFFKETEATWCHILSYSKTLWCWRKQGRDHCEGSHGHTG